MQAPIPNQRATAVSIKKTVFITRENAEGVINVKGVPSILELFRSIDPGKDEDSQPYLLGRISLQG